MNEAIFQEIVSLLLCSSFNWFEMDFQLQEHKIDQAEVEAKVEELLQELTPEESKLVMQSRKAFLQTKESVMAEEEREASGDMVSKSEQDDPEAYLKQDRKAALQKISRQKPGEIRQKR